MFIVIIGGIGTLEGPILGVIIFFGLRELMTGPLGLSGGWYLVGLGIIAVVVMIGRRRAASGRPCATAWVARCSMCTGPRHARPRRAIRRPSSGTGYRVRRAFTPSPLPVFWRLQF